MWSTLRPIAAGICASLALSGNGIAPLIFVVLLNTIHFGMQYWGVKLGFNFADQFMDKMESMQIKVWMEAATILGLFVVGGLSATWLNVSTKLTYSLGDASISLQSTLDFILPKMLPLMCTLLVFGLLRKGKEYHMGNGSYSYSWIDIGILWNYVILKGVYYEYKNLFA